jgi:predicted RNA-binding protein with RPS1 domain
MKYNTITIRVNPTTNKLDISIRRDDQDREETETTPHHLGFYHYPACMSDAQAFETLKNHLIEAHKEEMESVTQSMESISALEFSDYNG